MDTFAWILLGFTVLCLVTGFFDGLKKGLLRAVLRLVLLGASAAGAYLFIPIMSEKVMALPVGGQESLSAYVVSVLPEDFRAFADILLPVARMAIGVVCFVLMFAVLSLLTRIVYLILKLLVPSGGHTLGGLVGLVTGAVTALCVCAPLNGLFVDGGRLAAVTINDKPLIANAETGTYADSPVSKFYTTVGGGVYRLVSSMKKEDGTTVTLTGQTDALIAAAKTADKMNDLSSVTYGDGLTAENVGKIRSVCTDLDAIKAGLADESLNTLNAAVRAVADSLDLPINVKKLDLGTVSFEKEGDLVEAVYTFGETGNIVDLDATIRALSESTLVLPALRSADLTIKLDETKENQVAEAIEKLTDDENAAALRALFGLA